MHSVEGDNILFWNNNVNRFDLFNIPSGRLCDNTPRYINVKISFFPNLTTIDKQVTGP